MRRQLIFLGTLFCAAYIAVSADAAVLVEETTLKVEIRGWTYALETAIVRPAAHDGPLPVALITHGSPRSAADRPKIRTSTVISVAKDMAHRGWLAVVVIRRGFGASDGPFSEGYDCAAPNFRRTFATAAEDLAAAHAVIGKRPDADVSRTIALGQSLGGGAVLGWAATQPSGLLAIVNVSGGAGSSAPGINCDENGLVSTFEALGAATKIPSLWFYSENDSYLPPNLVRRLHAAYARGGKAELHVYGPMGEDGHNIWWMSEARVQWMQTLDGYLRAANLPTWDAAPIYAATGHLNTEAKRTLTYYLSFPTEKALAISRTKGTARFIGNQTDTVTARLRALEACEKAAGEPCDVLIENFTPVQTSAK
jgi:dienelactone hydrolase